MDSVGVRPRFRYVMRGGALEALSRTREAAERETGGADPAACEVEVRVVGMHLDAGYVAGHRRVWSPRVHAEFRPAAGGSEAGVSGGVGEVTEVLGHIGPRSEVWTLFVFGWVHFGLIGGFAVLFGLAQMSLGERSVWVWVGLGSLAVVAVMYVLARAGRRLAAGQTAALMGRLEGWMGVGGASAEDAFEDGEGGGKRE